jgi:hypothetical protein
MQIWLSSAWVRNQQRDRVPILRVLCVGWDSATLVAVPRLRFAPLLMTKNGTVVSVKSGGWMGITADLSTTLRFGRDDNSEAGAAAQWYGGQAANSSHPLRSALDLNWWS